MTAFLYQRSLIMCSRRPIEVATDLKPRHSKSSIAPAATGRISYFQQVVFETIRFSSMTSGKFPMSALGQKQTFATHKPMSAKCQ